MWIQIHADHEAAWPKAVYEDEDTFENLLQLAKDDNDIMLHRGVCDERTGTQYFAVILAVIGDWPWLIKSGKLARNFNHVVKQAKEIACPEGICHHCRAGQRGFSFEELQSRTPSWLSTIGQQDPFIQPPSPLSSLPHAPGQAASLFQFDVWHTCHLGVCKAFCGAALALLSITYPGRSKDARFELLNADFMQWCKTHRRQPLLTKLTKDTLGWDTNANYPSGSWYKGSLSTTFCEFIESMTKGKQFEDELLTKCGEAAGALNKFMTGLYENDAFLDRATAYNLAEHGLRFLRRYSYCAAQALQQGRCLFVITPKFHALHHICLVDMLLGSNRCRWVCNPIIWSVQMLEDFVGRNSRVSRRIHPSTATRRCTERHLQLAYHKFRQAGYLQ